MLNNKYNILHITAHMGGGVGKVLSGISSFAMQKGLAYKHKIILLERPEKMNFINICQQNNVEVIVASDYNDLIKEMKSADLVQLEWWHHPLMAKFLANFPPIPIRLCIWSHVSGCNYPFLSPELLKIPDKFIFTSDYSFENPYWQDCEKEYVEKKCLMINSSGGFEHITTQFKTSNNKELTIGYVGTQSFSKLHPKFIDFCKKVTERTEAKFIMVGDQTNQNVILKQANDLGIADKFSFIDYTHNVNDEFAKFDVFSYLLNPDHFGTTENVLLEAMAAGLPVVCLNQGAEKHLIVNNKTGLLIEGKEDYANAIERLANDKNLASELGKNASEFVRKKFSVSNTVYMLHSLYDKILLNEKKKFSFAEIMGKEPYEWFLSAVSSDEKEQFQSKKINSIREILKGDNKSSINHFRRLYPQDVILKEWSELVQNNE